MRLLVVEDNEGLQLGLKVFFESQGYEVDTADNGQQAMEKAQTKKPNLIILDLGLPDIDGKKLLSQIRKIDENVRFLILTARTQELEMLKSFKLGADDYVVKPFSLQVLNARVEAVLRRRMTQINILKVGSLTINFDTYQATLEDAPIHLSTREFDLLKLLFDHSGSPVNRNDILDEIWGMDSDAGPRTVDTYITFLRRKIEQDPSRPNIILSQRGIGYKLNKRCISNT